MFGKSCLPRLDVEVTYLQMFCAPEAPAPARAGVQVLRAHQPTLSFYRYLYAAVGKRWFWYQRRNLSDRELCQVIHDPAIDINVLYVDGVPAGYAELDRRTSREVEIAYFGLIGEFIGQGYGRFFIAWTLHHAWRAGVERVWLHTCSLDHPRALRVYQGAGLQPYRSETLHIADPREHYPELGTL
ncbi:MAG: GNAT family N-acetyltransferase [Gammaproteobacteria bacterium]|nr:GNAT family N-acetyltransferase [Gammaproteobacteria bacterium]